MNESRNALRERMQTTIDELTVLGQAIYHRVDVIVETLEVIPKGDGTDPADFMRSLFGEEDEHQHSDAVPYVIDHVISREPFIWVREEGGTRTDTLLGSTTGLDEPEATIDLNDHPAALYAVATYIGHDFLCIGRWSSPESYGIASSAVAIPTPSS